MKKKNIVKLRNQSLKHYDKMIAYVETLPTRASVTIGLLLNDIDETYTAEYCVFCNNTDIDHRFKNGVLCPLDSKKGCVDGLYIKMYEAHSKTVWLKYAKQIRKVIADLPDVIEE